MICVLAPRLARPTLPARANVPPRVSAAHCAHTVPWPGAPAAPEHGVYVSWPVGLYNSGNSSRGLLAGHGAGIMNHSPWVGHYREVLGRALVAAALAP